MFNEKQKQEYLFNISDKGEKHVKSISSLFNVIETIENEYGLEFCFLNKEEAVDLISRISGRKKSTKAWNISTLRDYNDWCIFNGYINRNVLDGVRYTDVDSSESIRTETVFSLEHLRKIVAVSLPDIPGEISMNTIYKAYVYLLYNGLTEQEIVEMTKDDATKIDSDNILVYKGKEICIQPFLRILIEQIANTDEVAWIKGLGGVVNHVKLAESNYLIGAISSLDGRLQNFKNVISRANKLYTSTTNREIRLSANRIYESGVFFRLLQNELDTGEINDSIIKEAFDIKEIKYKNIKTYQMQLYSVKQDYKFWKKAWDYEL